MRRIRRVAVIGAGNMGAKIAGFLAGHGFQVDLFDRRDEQGQSIAKLAWGQMVKKGAVYSLRDRFLITPRVMSEDAEVLTKADWIIEAVFEDLEVKQGVFVEVDAHRQSDAIVTTNTSGISINALAEGRSESFLFHFFGTHFFNPATIQPLLELIPGASTGAGLFNKFTSFAREDLNKGVVKAWDTPNFIGNRFGGLALLLPFHFWTSGLTTQDVDRIFEIIVGWAPLKTGDLVGLPLLSPVARNVFDHVTDEEDPFRSFFNPSIEKVKTLLDRGFAGRESKQGSGFFALRGKTKLMFDFSSGQYVEAKTGAHPSLTAAMAEKHPMRKIEILLEGDDEAAVFARHCFFRLMAYAPFLVERICDKLTDIDDAMQWGFAWPYGPFKIAQLYGLDRVVAGIKAVECANLLPEGFGHTPPYNDPLNPTSFLSFVTGKQEEITLPEEVIQPDSGEYKVIFTNQEASVYDLDQGICLVVFHSGPVNPAGPGIFEALHQAMDWAEAQRGAVVVGNNHPTSFCAGANLKLILQQSRDGEFGKIEQLIQEFQAVTQRMTYSSCPVVTAPHGNTLGGGSEIAMAGNLVVANHQITWAQPEIGVGLIAAAGGCMRTLRIALSGVNDWVMWGKDWSKEIAGPMVDRVWRTHAWGAVPGVGQSMNGHHARDLGFLRPHDRVIIAQGLGQPHVLWRAVQVADGMLEAGFTPPRPFVFNLPGKDLYARFKLECDLGEEGHHFPPHNATIARKIAWVLCGGETTLGEFVTEQDILDLEREAFLSLVGTDETRQAIARMVERK